MHGLEAKTERVMVEDIIHDDNLIVERGLRTKERHTSSVLWLKTRRSSVMPHVVDTNRLERMSV